MFVGARALAHANLATIEGAGAHRASSHRVGLLKRVVRRERISPRAGKQTGYQHGGTARQGGRRLREGVNAGSEEGLGVEEDDRRRKDRCGGNKGKGAPARRARRRAAAEWEERMARRSDSRAGRAAGIQEEEEERRKEQARTGQPGKCAPGGRAAWPPTASSRARAPYRARRIGRDGRAATTGAATSVGV